MKRIDTDAQNYVVFDVETNGLKAKKDDLLSISFYKPDDNRAYTRFLPLELSTVVKTTQYNGIKTEDLIGLKPLTQKDFDRLIEEFELDRRIILIFAGGKFDDLFLREYLHRKHIAGFEMLTFYNFKRQLISSKFSGGNVTKDNLCTMFGIQNVRKVHSGENDCQLEWELFKKLDGYYYLITEGNGIDDVFRMSPDYIIPVSFLLSHPNLGRFLKERPYITCKSSVLKTFEIDAKGLKKFETNFNGMTIEHLIDTMLKVKEIDSKEFLLNNKRKLSYIGHIPSAYDGVPMYFNSDGTVMAINKKDKGIEKELNSVLVILREKLLPLIEYIQFDIFHGKPILSQELVVNKENNILALCDLSTDEAVMEIKTNSANASKYKEQFFYEANGRRCFYLAMEWHQEWDNYSHASKLKKIIFAISEIETEIGEPTSEDWTQGRQEEQRLHIIKKLEEKLSPSSLKLLNYSGVAYPVKVKCLVCGTEWNLSYYKALKGSFSCSICHTTPENSKVVRIQKYKNKEDRLKVWSKRYASKISELSNNKLIVMGYKGSKENVTVECKKCGYIWQVRADHLMARCACPMCKRHGRWS